MKRILFLKPTVGLIHGQLSDDALKEHLEKLPGLTVTDYTPEALTEANIDFQYKGYKFSTDNAYDFWDFWVEEPCPDDVIEEIRAHCQEFI